MSNKQKYQQFKEQITKITDIERAGGILDWDQKINMPSKGSASRAQQIATLRSLSHDLSTGKELYHLITELKEATDLSEKEKRNVSEILRVLDKQKKFSSAFIKKMSTAQSEGYQAWVSARKENNFKAFQPYLEKLILLTLEKTETIGYKNHPYDALIDEYEPGVTTTYIEALFKQVQSQLVPFVKKILPKSIPNNDFMFKQFNKEIQWNFGLSLLKQMGYDFDAGRQDISPHPFCTAFSPQDVRITTKVNENNLYEMIWSCIHEGGHALYEQGLNPDEYGLPAGDYCSLAIHESQSRLWENNIARGLPYWKFNFKELKSAFPAKLEKVSLDDFYRAINLVQPSLIRIQADELTYHMHILIRFEAEKALIEKILKVKDLPAFWNSKYKEYLNIEVDNDANGVLQDVHWSMGSFGYFPTYSMGSFYAAQFYYKAIKDIPDLLSEIEQGKLSSLLTWLRNHIHQYGNQYTASELCLKATGEKLDFKYFMQYANEKYSSLYNL